MLNIDIKDPPSFSRYLVASRLWEENESVSISLGCLNLGDVKKWIDFLILEDDGSFKFAVLNEISEMKGVDEESLIAIANTREKSCLMSLAYRDDSDEKLNLRRFLTSLNDEGVNEVIGKINKK